MELAQWHHELRKILGFISNYKIGGYFPLDIALHIVVSVMVINFLLFLKVSFKWSCFILLGLELLKEFYDFFVLGSTMYEHVKDIVMTMIYPLVLLAIRFFKSK